MKCCFFLLVFRTLARSLSTSGFHLNLSNKNNLFTRMFTRLPLYSRVFCLNRTRARVLLNQFSSFFFLFSFQIKMFSLLPSACKEKGGVGLGNKCKKLTDDIDYASCGN